MRAVTLVTSLLAIPLAAAAQVPAGRDTTARDSARVELPEITVTVTRAPETVARIPAAISVVDRRDLKGAQATLGLDETLNNLPGVYVANRYNSQSRSAAGDPWLRDPLQLRPARCQGNARRRAADPARRPEPAHQRGLRQPGPDRGPARRLLVTVRQRVRWRAVAHLRAGRCRTLLPVAPRRGRFLRPVPDPEPDHRPQGPRERNALAVPHHRWTASGSAARASSPRSISVATTSWAAAPVSASASATPTRRGRRTPEP